MKYVRRLKGVLTIFLISSLLIQTASAYPVHNINKGTDYTTIQSAIDDADVGNTILVDSGTYYENVNVYKSLILKGNNTGNGPMIDGIVRTVIDARKQGASMILNAGSSIIEGFTFMNSSITDFPNNTGILVNSDNNIIRGNLAQGNEYDIFIYNSNNNIVADNYVWPAILHGIRLQNANYNKIINNTGIWNHMGILLVYSSNNDIKKNIMDNNYIGIYLLGSNNNIIEQNNVTGGDRAITISGNSEDNTIRTNFFIGNSYGIGFGGSMNNAIYNNFFNNPRTIQYIQDPNANLFNITKTGGENIVGGNSVGGNFWSKPDNTGFSQTCTNRGDGFCNLSYILDSNNIDYLPLTNNPSTCGNTPSGQNMQINPTANINIIFDSVIQCGNTMASTSDNLWGSFPNGYNPIIFYEINTTAGYTDSISVQITYLDQDISGIDENSIKMYHYENGNWIDSTTYLDTISNKVTGTVNSLSPFAIAGSPSGTTTPTVSQTTTPTSGNIVRGSSSNTFGIVILAVCLILISILMIRKR